MSNSIDTSTVVGLCDRALINIMVFTFARVGAVVDMRAEDFPYGQEIWTHPFTNSYVLTIHCSLACLPACYRPYSLSI